MPEPKTFSFLSEIQSLPQPSNEDFLRVGLENWNDLPADKFNLPNLRAELGNSVNGPELLAALFGNSPYLTHCVTSDPEFFECLLTDGSEAALVRLTEDMARDAAPSNGMNEVMKALRTAKKRVALLTACCDIGQAWPLLKITKTLSDFAGAAVDACLAHLLLAAYDKGDLVLPHPEDPTYNCGVIVLGMGKMGAFELNYSSDIDLIILFDREKVTYTGRKDMDEFFIRATRNLVKMMQDRTADGYVFRTDLRLRPDPGATPIALPLGAAHTYYESQGQNWERAAMIKARPVAGDLKCGQEFIEFLRPFVWRKFLDFAAIADIQAIKSQIHTHKGFSKITLDGHNIKIGRGGIREIEFFCQTQQLIEGGRNPNLRTTTTMGTLDALLEAENIKAQTRDDLSKAYVFLRTLEHRLQMINDEQTQLLPDEPEQLDRLGVFMGYNDPAEFRNTLKTTLETVQGHYDRLFEFEKNEERKAGRLVFTGSDDDPETLASITELGYEEPALVSQIIREWHHGRYRATRTTRAQQLLTALMPTILETLAETASPDAAFKRFDAFLKKLPAGVQLFSLFSAYPSLLKLVAKIMGMAPELADRLSANSTLLDGVLTSDFLAPLESREELTEDLELMLGTGRDFQDYMDISRRWVSDLKFRIGVQIIDNVDHGTGLGATVAAGEPLTRLAEVIMSVMLPRVEAELQVRHGKLPGGRFAVLAAGKLGSHEMTPRSDADLIFVYDAENENQMTDGDKPIPAGLYYTRLSQRFINALSALTGEGYLYEVDMRLRPHGNSGPIALTLSGFDKYYTEEAWTWEHLAITRARPIAGDASLMEEAAGHLKTLLTTKRDRAKITQDLLDMRARLAKEHASKPYWAIKNYPGGLMDLEFICQYLKLLHGADHPEILDTNTIAALDQMVSAGVLDAKVAADLQAAKRLYLNLQGLIRLSLKDRIVNEGIPLALKEALARANDQKDFETLSTHLEVTLNQIAGYFDKLVTVE